MKAIHADPKEIRKIFSETYIIPDFQRLYSWDIEQCDKLWEDFIDFVDSSQSNEEKYFLGNIVVHKEGDSYTVIDGQQRLTTLSLLIKAFHSKAGTLSALEECLKVKHPLTSDLTDNIRVNSLVIDEDKNIFYDIIFNNGNNTPDNSRFKINYSHLVRKLEEWWLQSGNSTNKLNNAIRKLLDQVVLLPINCGSQDDALTIFETINNRGMSLTDADIFKAKLHQSSKKDKDKFIRQWRGIEEHEWLFRIYMHILRAKDGNSGKEIALRTFFTKENRLSDWESVMGSLRMINDIEINWEPTPDIDIYWYILFTYPNYYWNYPLFVFLHKYGNLIEDEYVLDSDKMKEFSVLIEETLRYFLIKGVVYNSVNAVKDTVFKVCCEIEKEGDYLKDYEKNSSEDIVEFETRINKGQFGRYQRALILLASYLNPNQNQKDYCEVIKNNYHIEHILPVKWNNYDYWTEETWEKNLNTLGNLVPLEWKLNISAKNEFYSRKKDIYKSSKIEDIKELCNFEEWDIGNMELIKEKKLKRLLKFFIK